ncbi:hypothetical protein [uncultured Kordia sp.]|uniref:hypothetical protein n=1 Tax=uncultured Kordia sp. TaxID=507699 RepID=UPI002607F5EA|nr:hypothetical protein [uncultured Kordia sp.]
MFPFFHDKKRRRKNRLNRLFKMMIIAMVFVLAIIKLDNHPVSNISFITFLILFCFVFYKIYRIDQFYKYAEEFENNDSWLPKYFVIEKPSMLKKLEQQTFTQTLDSIGNKAFTIAIEKDLAYLHEQKAKIELKQKEWQTIPIPNDKEFWDIRERKKLGRRTAIYFNHERSEIQREFIRKVSLCDQMIAQANKIHNQLISKGHEVQNNHRNISGIDGLNSIES